MDSLKVSDAAAAAVAVAPRVKLEDIEGAIGMRFDTTADEAVRHAVGHSKQDFEVPRAIAQLQLMSICILVMKNGFTVVGTSAPASPENYDRELGRKFAYENAVRQLWPLMGFALRDKLAAAAA